MSEKQRKEVVSNHKEVFKKRNKKDDYNQKTDNRKKRKK